MKTKIICEKVDHKTQAFYAIVGKDKYFLFEQKYSSSVREFFKYGYYLDGVDYSKTTAENVRHTLEKLPSYIHYVEKEFNVVIYEKTRKQIKNKKKEAYKRKSFRWQEFMWKVA